MCQFMQMAGGGGSNQKFIEGEIGLAGPCHSTTVGVTLSILVALLIRPRQQSALQLYPATDCRRSAGDEMRLLFLYSGWSHLID